MYAACRVDAVHGASVVNSCVYSACRVSAVHVASLSACCLHSLCEPVYGADFLRQTKEAFRKLLQE